MRRKSTILVLLIAMFTLAACGPEPTPTPAPPTPTTGQAAADTPTTEAMAETPTTMVEESPTAAETPTTAAAGETPTAAPTVPPVDAEEAFNKVKARGRLIVGVKFDQPLFGLLNQDTNQPEGFDVDMGRAVAERLFGDPNAVQFEEAISRNRIPYLDEERVDVVFATMTANETRAQQILFSDCYYVAGQSLLVPTGSDIQSVDDLAGKTVGTVKGSTSEQNIRKFAPEATVELFDGYAQAVEAMDAGRVQAVTTDDIILYGFERQNPDKYEVVGGQFTKEPYAAGLKRGNTLLLDEVNATIREMKQNGEWAALYEKWIGQAPAEVPPQDWRDVYAAAGTPAAGTPASGTPQATGTPTP